MSTSPWTPARSSAAKPKAARGTLPVWAWIGSLVGHAAIVAGVGWMALRAFEEKNAAAEATTRGNGDIAIELPGVAEGTLRSDSMRDERGVEATAAGGDRIARVDTSTRGHGGSGAAPLRAIHLEDRAEPFRYSPDALSRLDRDQVQRLRTANERASYEDRRATTHPMELIFLATSFYDRQERRTPSDEDPSRGALQASQASLLGGKLGADQAHEDSGKQAFQRGAANSGSLLASPGVGVDDGSPGADHRSGARVAAGRPDVAQGPTTIPAVNSNRPSDTVDSEQEVSDLIRAQVHASMAGGAIGSGNGGSEGGGAPGAGGSIGGGSHPRPLGVGMGDWVDLQSEDPAFVAYFRKLHEKVDPLWAHAFPKSAILELKQGTVILRVTIESDGTAKVAWPPLRASGIDEFDRNCADAVRRAAPFDAIPAALGHRRLILDFPFAADNPIIK
ncbi:MAG: energy transducer TonB [Polyangiaceae bacterium]